MKTTPDKINQQNCAAELGAPTSISRHRRGTAPFGGLIAGLLMAISSATSSADAQPVSCLSIACPPDMVVEGTGYQGTVVNFNPVVVNTCGSLHTVLSKPASGSLFPLGTTTVNCGVTDNQRRSAQCSFKVNVRDTTPPVIVAPESFTVDCESPAGAVVEYGIEVRDVCDPQPQWTCIPPSGSLLPIGVTPVQCIATDASGNSSTNEFTVTVNATCADCVKIECPTNVVITLGRGGMVSGPFGPIGVPVDYAVMATNACTGSNVLALCNPPSGSLFGVGTNWVNCSAYDLGVRVFCSFQVVVLDLEPPKITVPRPFLVQCKETRGDGVKGATVNFTAKATDNADAFPKLVCTPPSGSFFPVGTNTVVCVATDKSGNSATNQFTITVTPSLACSLLALEEMPDNWGFELGLTAWEDSGDAFLDQPVQGDRLPVKRVSALSAQLKNDIGGDYWKDLSYPVGHKGDHWIGTAENVNALPGGLFDAAETEARTGTLRSKSFIIQKPQITFLIGGHENEAKLRVELLIQVDAPGIGTEKIDGLDYKVWGVKTGHNREVMRWENWGVYNQIGKRAIIRIVDNSTTGHLNVDDFRFEDAPPLFQTVKMAGKTHPAWIKHEDFFYRWDSPVWGFADLHTHPMSHLGFGGYVMHGEPDGNISVALENCRCSHGGWGFDNECGDYLREIVMGVMEDGAPSAHGNGYLANDLAQFNAWPVFWTKTHQQMWHQWVKRAHGGGLRVMVALCVNNPLLSVGTKGHLANDDKSVGDAQIEGLVEFVDQHSDFMEIARDPFELRDIVRRDKLAVIIGSELDDIGNFARNQSVNQWNPSNTDKDKVRNEIDRLYQLGLRYIFPVHLVDNHFGGTAIAGDMLNVANKFLNHQAFDVAPGTSSERINLYLDDLDFTEEAAAIFTAAPLAPLILPALLPFADAILASQGVPPGTGAAIGAGVLPLALMGTALLPIVGVEIGEAGIPSEILPLFGNYPNYYQKGEKPGWDHGHKNAKGLTPLGVFAVREMMKRGMMIDIDHMSQKAVAQILELATNNYVGYPLNSGHNSPRDLGHERGENSRTLEQLKHIRELGGLWGVGYENGEAASFDSKFPQKNHAQASVANDCAGTSKTFAQNFLYGVEVMQGRGLAFGTDINGLIPGPGPRFGPMSAFALGDDPHHERREQVLAQFNGVRYTPEHGRPITTPVFNGRAIDPDVNTGYPRTQLGYAYNKEQGDLFAAIGIFYWRKTQVENGLSDNAMVADVNLAANAMNGGNPDRRRIQEYAIGLLRGIKDTPVGSDLIYTDVESLQRIGKALYKVKVLGQAVPSDVYNSSALKPRYDRAVQVWNHFHRSFGDNEPLKRAQTGLRQWDINFEGIAHYGMLPDFLQDLHNVGMDHRDMSVLFKSAEHFAQMWSKTLEASWAMVPQFVGSRTFHDNLQGALELSFTTDDGEFEVEESDGFNAHDWGPAQVEEMSVQGNLRTVRTTPDKPIKFYRLRKK